MNTSAKDTVHTSPSHSMQTVGSSVCSPAHTAGTSAARRTDPITSHLAAARSAAFANTHCGRILAALKQGVATAHRLSELTGLTVVQIDRRLPDLQDKGKARPVVVLGQPLIVGGFRVWEAI